MSSPHSDLTAGEARQALAWLVEMGADEIVQDEAVDRFATPAIKAPPPAQQEQIPAAVEHRLQTSSAEACGSMEELAHAFAAIADCALPRTATNMCFAGGNLAGHTMVIGDVAGRDEDLEGAPFAGASATLLARMLGAIGLSSAMDVPAAAGASLVNLIPWRPPGNRPATPLEVEQCAPFLRRAIEILQPRLILAFGNLPAQALLGRSETLIAMRGKWFDVPVRGRTIPLISTFSPRVLLQQRAQKRLAWRDLLAFQEKMLEARA